jgi:hypothetical protein
MGSSVSLEASVVSATPDLLVFRYRARNAWDRDLFVFNRIARTEPDGRKHLDANQVYVVAEGKTLHVSKQLVEVPEDFDVLAPEIPFLTRMSPGATVEEEIRIALPVRESYPYTAASAERAPGEKRSCEQLLFTLGYFHAREASWVRPATLDGQEVLATDYGFAIQTRESVSAAPLRVRADCIVLADPRRRTRG